LSAHTVRTHPPLLAERKAGEPVPDRVAEAAQPFAGKLELAGFHAVGRLQSRL